MKSEIKVVCPDFVADTVKAALKGWEVEISEPEIIAVANTEENLSKLLDEIYIKEKKAVAEIIVTAPGIAVVSREGLKFLEGFREDLEIYIGYFDGFKKAIKKIKLSPGTDFKKDIKEAVEGFFKEVASETAASRRKERKLIEIGEEVIVEETIDRYSPKKVARKVKIFVDETTGEIIRIPVDVKAEEK